MRHLILIFTLYFINISIFAQNVVIKGIAIDTTKGRNPVTVILNDTIHKILNSDKNIVNLINYKKFSKFFNDSKIKKVTDKNGKFKFKAKITDSLYFSSFLHITKKFAVKDLIKIKDLKIKLDPEICHQYANCEEKRPEFFVFVGEKINLNYAEKINYCNIISLDSKFEAHYKIVQKVFGDFKNDTIKFTVYDHYGTPAFGDFKNVLLFVGKYCNEFVHLKYKFADVYKTKNNKWATPYKSYDYKKLNEKGKFIPEIIDFEERIEFDIKNASKKYIEDIYPKPFYEIRDDKAIAVYGNYIEDAFGIAKEIFLESYNFFKKNENN